MMAPNSVRGVPLYLNDVEYPESRSFVVRRPQQKPDCSHDDESPAATWIVPDADGNPAMDIQLYRRRRNAPVPPRREAQSLRLRHTQPELPRRRVRTPSHRRPLAGSRLGAATCIFVGAALELRGAQRRRHRPPFGAALRVETTVSGWRSEHHSFRACTTRVDVH